MFPLLQPYKFFGMKEVSRGRGGGGGGGAGGPPGPPLTDMMYKKN